MSRNANGAWAVTGAGQGIGLAITVEAARRGYETLALVLNESMTPAVIEATQHLPGKVSVQVLDVTRPGEFCFPDNLAVLVNNAGIRPNSNPVEETPMSEWRAVFDVNFFGALDMSKRAIPLLRKAGRGVICNVTSGSLSMPLAFLGPYRGAKWALSGVSETLRIELAPFGVRLVEVLPGSTASGLNADSMTHHKAGGANFPTYAPMADRLFEAMRKQFNEPTPAEDAAIAIVDAILDDHGPMRYGTDEGSRKGLQAWRNQPDEEIAAGMLALYKDLLP
jgi:NAD(P)-dependent dehydrogenase (short-subunit alcohol dehydrogenase family)